MKTEHIKLAIKTIAFAMIDQITKWFAMNGYYEPYESVVSSISPWIKLTYTENTGIAWSIQIPQLVLIPLNIMLLILVIFAGATHLNLKNKKAIILLAMVSGGALGNIYDRVLHGFVVDFISIGWWPVFNIADILLTVGIFLIIIFYDKIKRTDNE